MNINGLTFDDWLAAAARSSDKGKGPITLMLISAWEAGEDPCEWRHTNTDDTSS